MKNLPALALIVTAPALAACSESPASAPDPVRPVLSVLVEPRESQTFGFAGTIEPEVSAALAFRILGRVVAREVGVGDVVQRGATIAALDPASLEFALQATRADLSSAEAQFANAAAAADRQSALLAAANTSQAIYDTAQQARETAAANVERAKAAVAKAEEQLGYTRLFSDFAGVVTAVGAEVGQTVSAGQMVVTVARSDSREAVVDVPDRMIGGLAAGDDFDVVLQSFPSIRARARLREIAPQSDSSTRTRRVRLTLTDAPEAFRLGSTITATRLAGAAPAISLPLSALLEKDGKTSVWVVDPRSSAVNLTDIRIVARDGGSFTVADGLVPGARVVTAGVNSLAAGQKVRIAEEAAP